MCEWCLAIDLHSIKGVFLPYSQYSKTLFPINDKYISPYKTITHFPNNVSISLYVHHLPNTSPCAQAVTIETVTSFILKLELLSSHHVIQM